MKNSSSTSVLNGIKQLVLSSQQDGDDEQTAAAQTRILALFALFVESERNSIERVKATRSVTLSAKERVEKLYLSLSNLHYESACLENDISSRDGTDLLHQDIDLISIEDFLTSAPAELIPMDEQDQNQLMLARLTFELQERNRLATLLAITKPKKLEVMTLNLKLEQELERLEKAMIEISHATFASGKNLGILLEPPAPAPDSNIPLS